MGSVAIVPSLATMGVGDTLRLAASVLDTRGKAIVRTVSWSSSSPTTLSVSASGLVTGLAVGGPVTVTAEAGGKSASAQVSVHPPAVATVAVTSASDTVVARTGTAQLVATARDAKGQVIAGASTTWSVSDTAVASIDDAGRLTGVAAGRVTVTATMAGVQGRLTLRLVDADLPTILQLFGDPYLERTVGGLSSTIRALAQSALVSGTQAATTGRLVGVIDALGTVRALAATEPTERALLAVVALFLDQIERHLRLT